MDAIVFGNVTLDIICYPVDEVPRRESISFDEVAVSPGGCGSNTAIGLAALGVPTGIFARTGDDDSADLLFRYWERTGVDTRFVRRTPGTPTGVSVGLIDSGFQPRFVHTSGANANLSAEIIEPLALSATQARFFHIAGFFVLPELLNNRLAEKLAAIRSLGLQTSLDVVFNVRMDDPNLRASLWAAMPHLDYFLCNDYEAFRLTGQRDPGDAACALKTRGPRNVIVKLGAEGCRVEGDSFTGKIPAPKVDVVDTAGAGDAFAAGLIATLLDGKSLPAACEAGNAAGARITTQLGAIAAWMTADQDPKGFRKHRR